MPLLRTFLAALAAAAVGGVHANTLRWSSQGDVVTMDPHAFNEALVNGVLSDVYETLVGRDRQLRLAPLLATSWSQPNPATWRFVLRKGVKFHDGAPFTADDVVFSVQRAMSPSSNMKIYATGVAKVVKVDEYTVDIETAGPNPVLADQLTELRIMSKAWSEKNKVVAPPDFAEVAHIPLHHQVIPWSMRPGVEVVHRADNRLTVNWVSVK